MSLPVSQPPTIAIHAPCRGRVRLVPRDVVLVPLDILCTDGPGVKPSTHFVMGYDGFTEVAFSVCPIIYHRLRVIDAALTTAEAKNPRWEHEIVRCLAYIEKTQFLVTKPRCDLVFGTHVVFDPIVLKFCFNNFI